MKRMSARNRDAGRSVGVIGSLVMLGFASSAYSESGGLVLFLVGEGEEFPAFPVYLLFSALFLASAVFVLAGVQAGLFFLLSAIHAGQAASHGFGLGFSIVGALILLRRGWFLRMPALKALVTSAVGALALIGSPIASGAGLRRLPSALIWTGAFVAVVVGLAQHRYLAALAPKKKLLRLSDFGLTAREQRIVKMRISGKSAKEIADEFGLALSTVRNNLSFAYRKLGIEDGKELVAMAERYTVE